MDRSQTVVAAIWTPARPHPLLGRATGDDFGVIAPRLHVHYTVYLVRSVLHRAHFYCIRCTVGQPFRYHGRCGFAASHTDAKSGVHILPASLLQRFCFLSTHVRRTRNNYNLGDVILPRRRPEKKIAIFLVNSENSAKRLNEAELHSAATIYGGNQVIVEGRKFLPIWLRASARSQRSACSCEHVPY